jgi:hypothetical protein
MSSCAQKRAAVSPVDTAETLRRVTGLSEDAGSFKKASKLMPCVFAQVLVSAAALLWTLDC